MTATGSALKVAGCEMTVTLALIEVYDLMTFFCPEGINIHRKNNLKKQVCPSEHKHLQFIPYREIGLRDLPPLWILISSGENSIDSNRKCIEPLGRQLTVAGSSMKGLLRPRAGSIFPADAYL
jgi:hypothetical protein